MVKNVAIFFERIKRCIEMRDAQKLKDITTECSLELALIQEKAFFYTALIAYALSKIMTKPRYGEHVPPLLRKAGRALEAASAAAKEGRTQDVEKALEGALGAISELEQIDRRFVHDVLEKGRTKIAAMLYAEGLSLETAVSLTGAQRYEVMSYSGKTMMADRFGKTLSVRERMKKARALFK